MRLPLISRVIRLGIFISLGVLISGSLIYHYYNRPLHPIESGARAGGAESFLQEPQSGQYRLGPLAPVLREMETDGIIRSATFAIVLARVFGYDTRVQEGVYRFTSRLSTAQILSLLIDGMEESILFTVVEGADLYDIDEALYTAMLIREPGDFIEYTHSPTLLEKLRVQLSEALDATHTPDKNVSTPTTTQEPSSSSSPSPPAKSNTVSSAPPLTSAEGFIYPNTYRLRLSRAREDLVSLGTQEFFTRIIPLFHAAADQREPASSAPAQLQQWLALMTMASLVEKETFVEREKPTIASVLVNRLRIDMKLRYDPTIIYALKKAGVYASSLTSDGSINIKEEHFSFQSPYNTYAVRGLPPGPISSFTESSFSAALYPAKTPYLFFVAQSRSDPALGHAFSETYEGHLLNIERYLRTPR